MSLWQWEKIQEVLRRERLDVPACSARNRRRWVPLFALSAFALLGTSLQADDADLWKEYGLVQQQSIDMGRSTITTYRMKDLTGALAVWEWLRSPTAQTCDLAPFCTADSSRTVISTENYVLVFEGPFPKKPNVDAVIANLPEKRDTSLPAILTFLPKQNRVADSARYVLGQVSLARFAPDLSSVKPGFEQGAEAQVAAYRLPKTSASINLVLFYYPTPEMARLHVPGFKKVAGSHVKRSGVLVAIVPGAVSDDAAETLLGRVGYEAKITWNETPPPNPVKPLYKMLVDILYMSGFLTILCLAAGLFYGGMRLYRRRYGTLEEDEAMTTLHLR